MCTREGILAQTLCSALRNGKDLNEARVKLTYSIEELASQSFKGSDLDKISIDVEGVFPGGTRLTDLLHMVASRRWLGHSFEKLTEELIVAENWKIIKLLMPLLHGFDKTMQEHDAKLKTWSDQGDAIRGLRLAGCHDRAAELCQKSASVKPGAGKCCHKVLNQVAKITSVVGNQDERVRLVQLLIHEWQQYAEAEAKPAVGKRCTNKYSSTCLLEAFVASKDPRLQRLSQVSSF